MVGSPLADDMGFVKVDTHTLQSVVRPEAFAVGDATTAPTSKAGAVAHFEIDKKVQNLVNVMTCGQPTKIFDGHAPASWNPVAARQCSLTLTTRHSHLPVRSHCQ